VQRAHVCMQVVHGGDNDVLWLQRDYHIYMVNVFDTEKACQVGSLHILIPGHCTLEAFCITRHI